MAKLEHVQKNATVHSSEVIYKGRQFSFVKDQITLPHKVDAEMAFVKHPGSAVIVPVFEDQTLGLIKQYRYVVKSYIYEVPAGTMDPYEQPKECAARELEEETGFVATDLISLGKTLLLPAYSDEISYIFLAKGLIPTAQKLDADEIISVEQYTITEIIEMIDTGIIVDALSILAIYRSVKYLE
ncbi:MAG: NUDIX hydrolase [Desulfobacterales bacterium]|nr:NUDIX hydrolase [Desulfobacterales bacterium]